MMDSIIHVGIAAGEYEQQETPRLIPSVRASTLAVPSESREIHTAVHVSTALHLAMAVTCEPHVALAREPSSSSPPRGPLRTSPRHDGNGIPVTRATRYSSNKPEGFLTHRP